MIESGERLFAIKFIRFNIATQWNRATTKGKNDRDGKNHNINKLTTNKWSKLKLFQN